jgi:hypothetical protein
LGEWLADRFGMTSGDKDEYAKSVVMSDLDEPGIEDVVRKVMADIGERSASISEDDIRAKMTELEGVAAQQIARDFPEALGDDHEKVGD